MPAQPPAPPVVPREFRGMWIATVTNIDWPNTNDSVAVQQQKLRALLDKAVELRLNVIVFQIRPACDALYVSSIEPWSQWLTGRQGRAPNPVWDPLQYAIDQCRLRGLELHAWFNPYRAGFTSTSHFDPGHIRNTRPDLVRTYDRYYWLDPGHPDVQDYSLSVFMDVVNRYDIDGLHIDDYFYPYPVSGISFPDDATYAAYNPGGLSRGDWRRKNVDDFVLRVYTAIKAAKPHVKFGISPFGIWRPGNPPGIVGLDSYTAIYADSKKWWNNGWCDYFAPQLYWKIEQSGQEYPKLLDWWISQNLRNRTLVPGLFTGRVSYGGTPYWSASDITRQVEMTQGRAGAVGNVHFSARAFTANGGAGGDNINAALKNGVYAQSALVPPSPWLDATLPEAPSTSIQRESNGRWRVSWEARGDKPARFWVLYYYANGSWSWEIVRGQFSSFVLPGTGASEPEWAIVSAVDRLGNESVREVFRLVEHPNGWLAH